MSAGGAGSSFSSTILPIITMAKAFLWVAWVGKGQNKMVVLVVGGHTSSNWGAGGGDTLAAVRLQVCLFNGGFGGGGSFNSGTDQNNTAGVNEGLEKVIITLLSSSAQ